MMIRGTEIAAGMVVKIAGGVLLIVLVITVLSQCGHRRNDAAQGKVNSAQSEAAVDSGHDAVNTVAGAGQRESDSESLTRSNERDIRNAQGANDPVNPAVSRAGRNALCLRGAYRDHPDCKVQQPTPK